MSSTGVKKTYGGLAAGFAATTVAFAFVACILVVLRGFHARTISGRLRWDFVHVVLGTMFGLAGLILWNIACEYGMGQNVADVPFLTLFESLKYVWIGVMLGIFSFFFAKASIAALYLQVLTPTQKIRRWMLHSIIAAYFVLSVLQFAFVLFSCNPVPKLWFMTMPGSCKLKPISETFSYVFGVSSAALDFFLALYPTTIVWNMQASRRTKIGFCALMAGGIIPGIAAIFRVYYTNRLFLSNNPTIVLIPFLISGTAECWLIIILGSIPPLRPFFTKRFGKAKKAVLSAAGSKHNSKKGATPFGTDQDHSTPHGSKVDGSKIEHSRHDGSALEDGGRRYKDEEKGQKGIVVDQTYSVDY